MPQKIELTLGSSSLLGFILVGSSGLGNAAGDTQGQVFSCFQVVELVTGGAQVPVTNENKILYLNLLAQYRLANQVREEVDHFLKGNRLSAPRSFLPLCPRG